MHRTILCLLTLTLAVLLDCSSSDNLAGGGASGTGNGIAGVARLPGGAPAGGARVFVRPAGYVADTARIAASATRADAECASDGAFSVDSLEAGTYVVEITDQVTYSIVREVTFLSANSLVDFQDLTLDTGAWVQGRVEALGYSRPPRTFVQVRGLERLATIDSTGHFSLALLPRGMRTLRLVPSDANLPPMEFNADLGAADVALETRILVPLSRTRTVALNATSITGNLFGFPALLRLDASALNFSEVGPGGDGLRFYRNGTELYHQIELWDSAVSQAVVWVKVDTVFGDSLQHLSMTWQTTARSPYASPEHVFDTAAGFMAVWHLGEEGPGIGSPDLFRDASANAFHGTDSVANSGKKGIIGKGQQFDRFDNILINRPVRPVGPLTISAWFCLDTIDMSTTNSLEIVTTLDWNNGSPYGFSMHLFRNDINFIVGDGTPRRSAASWDRVTLGWMHYVVVWRPGSDTVAMYANGVRVWPENPLSKAAIVYATAQTRIGSPTDQGFTGALDEIRVESVARSPDWIRLSYENQRVDQRVVIVR